MSVQRGAWAKARERMKQGRALPVLRRTDPPTALLLPPSPSLSVEPAFSEPNELQKALAFYEGQQSRNRRRGQASDYATARTFKEAQHLPLLRQPEAGGRGPQKMVGVSYEILRAFVRQSPWVGAAINIRQREVGASKWRIVPNLEEHQRELDLLRQLVMGARHFPEYAAVAKRFRPHFIDKKMVSQLLQATLDPEGLNASEVGYRFRLAYLELLMEAEYHTARARELLETPNSSGDADCWSEILKGLVPDLLTLDCAALELRRSDSPLDAYGHPLPTNPILEMHWADGATIRPCLDEFGALLMPSDEDPDAAAYEQWIDGKAVGTFQRHNLIRFIENPQTDIWFRGYGFSRVEYLMMTMILESHGDKAKLEEFKRAFYGGFLNVKSKAWVQEDIDSFRGYIEEQLEGNRKLPILAFPDGAEWINTAMKEATSNNSIEQRKHHVQRICATFEISPAKLGITDDTNYSTADSSQDAGDDGLRHVLDVIDGGVTRWIVRDPGFGTYPWLKYESRPAHEREEETELEKLEKELNLGIVLPNEIRMERGHGPIEGGDKPYAYFTEFYKAKGQADGGGGMMGEEDPGMGEEDDDTDEEGGNGGNPNSAPSFQGPQKPQARDEDGGEEGEEA